MVLSLAVVRIWECGVTERMRKEHREVERIPNYINLLAQACYTCLGLARIDTVPTAKVWNRLVSRSQITF